MGRILFMVVVGLILVAGATPVVAMITVREEGLISWLWMKSLMLAAVVTFFYLSLVIVARFVHYEFVRILYYYLWILSIGFCVAVFYWIVFWWAVLLWAKSLVLQWWFSLVILGARLFLVVFSIVNFEKPVTLKEITLQSEKVTKTHRFVHVADTQYWTVSKKYMNKIMHTVFALQPDFILFIGDLIDFDGYKENDFAVFEDASAPIYFVSGNHEYYHQPKRIHAYLDNITSIQVLDDRQTMVNNEIALVGLDYQNHLDKTLESSIDKQEINTSFYTILINHVPESVEYAASKWFDLQLYGHTHNGQIRPWNYLVKKMFPYGDGKVHTIDWTTVYTTQGAWLWWPKMRLGTQNEIVLITLEPKK